MQRLEALMSGQVKVSASPTGFTEFDTLIGEGLRQSELSILAGSTGTGKTTLSTQWFMAAKNAMYVTMEMSAFDLISQIAEQHTGVWRSKTTSGKITSDEYAGIITVLDLMTTQNNRVWECPKMSVHQLRIMLRQLKARNQLPELVIVDGLWLMDKAGAPSDKEYANYPDTVNKLVELATNFNTHILLIHQLKIERRGEVDVDTLSGGGSLAYGAQNVFFLGRESDFTTLKIRKNRSGRGTDNKAILSFDKSKGTYSVLSIERA
jgi:replicative DNA helicase